MAKEGTIQLSAATGGDTAPGGAYILTEIHGVTCTGICAAVSGLTQYNVQVAKMAWGTTAEYYWVDNAVSSSGTTGCGAGPLPTQLLDSSGNAAKFTAISGSSNTALDVFLRGQGSSAAQLDISNIHAGNGTTTGNYIAVAGTTNGAYVPIAGSTAGAAIPHIGGTGDVLGSLTAGGNTLSAIMGATGAFSGTISAKLRTMTSDLRQLIAGGTGSDGVVRSRGLSMDIRTIAGGLTLATKAELAGFTFANSIQAIAGGVTIGIGSVSIDNPVVIGSRTAGATFERVNGTSTTLQSGVRIKNVAGSGTITVGYDSSAGNTTGMTQGFQLDDAEEMFVEVDNLNKVYVKASSIGLTFSYYAT